MKILWLCNSLIPEVSSELHVKTGKPESWLSGIFNCIKNNSSYELTYLFPENRDIDQRIENVRFISYTQIIESRFETAQVLKFEKIIKTIRPDVIHCFGTELPHTYAMICAAEESACLNRVVASIQGLVSAYSIHYYAYLPENVLHKRSLKDIVQNTSVAKGKKVFDERGKYEIQALKKIKHVIGRTEFDEGYCKLINKDMTYHFCNEILRDAFYHDNWSYDSCEKYSIFTSQSFYPIKGFHLLLEAMPYILERYPQTHIYTTGRDPLSVKLKDKIRLSYYNVYVGKLIKKYNLKDKVTFLGLLDEEGMKNRYLKSNVFVSCSSIENSPNSLGEAMMLGVPVISSDVGGVKNFIRHLENGYIYQADATYMLANYIIKVFEKADESKFQEEAKADAERIFNKETNMNRLFEIYREISV